MSSINNPAGGGGGGDAPVTSLPSGGAITTSGYYDNAGAAGVTTMTFTATGGISAYIKRVASQELRVAPVAGSQIVWSGGTMAVDEYLRLLTDGAVIHCVVDDNGDVQVTSEFGAIQEQTP
jgi:hypothetical protein